MGAPGQAVDRDDIVQQNLLALIAACDLVFGSTSIALAILGTWLHAVPHFVHLTTVVGLWFYPLFNVFWSAVTRDVDRAKAEIWRNVISLPVTLFLYVAETGIFERLWFPALVLMVGCSMSFGIATRRALLGYAVTMAYGGGIFAAGVLSSGALDAASVSVSVGLVVTGLVFSQVAAHLGRSLEEARLQRDGANDQRDKAEAVAALLAQSRREVERTLVAMRLEVEQRARIEVELRHAQKLESVGRLAAGVAHEINTPIQFVKDNVQFVLDATNDVFSLVEELGTIQRSIVDVAALPAANRAATRAEDAADLPYLVENVPLALANAVDGLNRVATIVRTMKAFAHPDTKEMADADLNRAIEDTLVIASNEYKYVAELETDLDAIPLVWCHIAEINQALLNIIVNAAHAIGEVVAGTAHKGCIRIRTRRDGEDVVLSIADTGAGIPVAAREHVFDPFFTTKEVGRGTGQGLAITHSVIVDKHGGKLWFETDEGKGTTFFIRLPIRGVPPTTTAVHAA